MQETERMPGSDDPRWGRWAGILRAGDRDRFREIVDELFDTVQHLVARQIGDFFAAEDVAVEVFLELWERRAEFDSSKGGLKNWVVLIARCRSIDQFRRLARRPVMYVDAQALDETPCCTTDRDGSNGKSEASDETILQGITAESMQDLSPGSRKVIRIFIELPDVTDAERAEALGMKLNAFQVAKKRAFDAYRELAGNKEGFHE